ncbi:Protein similar [Pseudolycoriella hygida]|uniref:Protein similar n=1 Tax=Pseudolycoriella hygida TaxID=35572 RepID=A0A9Q0MVU1_9DIPT|nr:Protein similar [Pseudolycoriella hygida]
MRILENWTPESRPAKRNNEKRKEKSRDAARCRRSRETEIFTDLASILPLRSEEVEQLDKASVMRLSIAYLKIRDMLEFFPANPIDKVTRLDESIANGDQFENLVMQAVDGFLLVLSADGDIIFVSENVSDILGIQQIDVIGQQIWDYSHQCDHDELRDILNGRRDCANEKDGVANSHHTIFLRLKCTLTSRGRSVNIKSASYKVIQLTGHTAVKNDKRQLIVIGRAVPHPSNIEIPLGINTFLTKHSLDMKFTYVDEKMSSVLGYESEDLMGKSLFEFQHGEDSASLMKSFKSDSSKCTMCKCNC